MVKWIIKSKLVNVNQKNTAGMTPLLTAFENQCWNVIEYMMSNEEVDLNVTAKRMSPISKAADFKKIEIVWRLIESGDTDYRSAVRAIYTTNFDNLDIARKILELDHKNINIDFDKNGTLIQHAVEDLNVEAIKFLLTFPNINVNVKNRSHPQPAVEIHNILQRLQDNLEEIKGNPQKKSVDPTEVKEKIKRAKEIINILEEYIEEHKGQKKSRAKKEKKEEKPAKKGRKSKKSKKVEEEEEEEENEEEEEVEEEEQEEVPEEKPRPKRGMKASNVEEEVQEEKPKRGRKPKKVEVKQVEEKPKRGRKASNTTEETKEEKPRRGRSASKTEAEVEKPKHGRKVSKAEEEKEDEKPKRGRRTSKVEEEKPKRANGRKSSNAEVEKPKRGRKTK